MVFSNMFIKNAQNVHYNNKIVEKFHTYIA